jgi:DNA-directed RNA polymerase alpha subunit
MIDSIGKLGDWHGIQLSTRARNVLDACGVSTVEEAKALFIKDIERLPNLGRKTIFEILNAVHGDVRMERWVALQAAVASQSKPPRHLGTSGIEDILRKIITTKDPIDRSAI